MPDRVGRRVDAEDVVAMVVEARGRPDALAEFVGPPRETAAVPRGPFIIDLQGRVDVLYDLKAEVALSFRHPSPRAQLTRSKTGTVTVTMGRKDTRGSGIMATADPVRAEAARGWGLDWGLCFSVKVRSS